MYTPKLMLLIFNCILIIISAIFIHRALTDHTSSKLVPLESAADVVVFQKIWTCEGILLFVIAFLGFWGTDAESRVALTTYKVLLCCTITTQIITVCYFSLNPDVITEQIQTQLTEWVEEYQKENTSIAKLDDVQSYLDCCEFQTKTTNGTTKYPTSCCPFDVHATPTSCDQHSAFEVTCTMAASKYFRKRTFIYSSFLLRTLVPQAASIVFADIVSAKILLLQNLMQGKFS